MVADFYFQIFSFELVVVFRDPADPGDSQMYFHCSLVDADKISVPTYDGRDPFGLDLFKEELSVDMAAK